VRGAPLDHGRDPPPAHGTWQVACFDRPVYDIEIVFA